MSLLPILYDELVRRALAEDLGRAGDLTTDAIVPADQSGRAAVVAREAGRIAGLEPALPRSGCSTRACGAEIRLPDGSDARGGGDGRARERTRPRAPDRRAHGAQPARPPVRHRDRHARRGRAARGPEDARRQHAQDDAGPARAREVRGARRRRRQPPLSASTTPCSSRTTTSRSPGACARPSSARAAARAPGEASRSRSTRSSSSTRRWRRRRRGAARQHGPRDAARGRAPLQRPGAHRGLGRHPLRQRRARWPRPGWTWSRSAGSRTARRRSTSRSTSRAERPASPPRWPTAEGADWDSGWGWGWGSGSDSDSG